MKTKSTWQKAVAIFCILLIFGGSIFSIWMIPRNMGIRRTGNPAVATISYRDLSRWGDTLTRIAEFTTGDGHTVRHITLWTPFGSVGDNVNIYYCPDNPQRFAMQSIEWGLIITFLVTTSISGLFVFMAVRKIYLKVNY